MTLDPRSEDQNLAISLPGNIEKLTLKKTNIIIGANGSGKTRFASWLQCESEYKGKVWRIAAHKSLTLNESFSLTDVDKAQHVLHFGHEGWNEHHLSSRYNNKPSTHLVTDFDKLLVFLGSQHGQAAIKYLEKIEVGAPTLPTSKLSELKKIWERVLTHRQLDISNIGKIQVFTKDTDYTVYNGSEMSDGERAVFYIIGYCLAAPENNIIIIDEPELHLNRSIRASLYTEIEAARTDCTFIYFTHDIDFVASMPEAQKIWMKSYDGKEWEYEILKSIEGLPETLLLQVLGSRKKVVLIEGVDKSWDLKLYSNLFPDFLFIPCNGCSSVINSVKGIRNFLTKNKEQSHIQVYGLIDRDRLPDETIAELVKDHIYTLDVAAVENLLCIKEVIKFAYSYMKGSENQDKVTEEIIRSIFDLFKSKLEYNICVYVNEQIRYKLKGFDHKSRGEKETKKKLEETYNNINVEEMFRLARELFNGVIEKQDYELLLKLYSDKSMPKLVAKRIGLNAQTISLLDYIITRIKERSDHRKQLLSYIKPYLGEFRKYAEV